MPEGDWLRRFSTSLVIILSGAILGRVLNVISWPFSSLDPYLTILILFAVVLFFPKLNLYLTPASWIRRWLFRRRFMNPEIGILNGYVKSQINETRCISIFTEFSPEDWRDYFESRGHSRARYRVTLIPSEKIGQRFAVIINPFGEAYPERDLIELSTFKTIKKFVHRGGIFVHAGGVPFYYSWDVRTGRKRSTSKDLHFSSFTSMPVGQPALITPAYARGRVPSLVDTLVRAHFHVRTTADDTPNIVSVFQTAADRSFVMDIEQVGGTDKVEEWRAVVEETPQFIPFLRCKTPKFGEVYPLCAVPFGKGYFVLAGMTFATQAMDGNIRIARAQFEKVCTTIVNMIDRISQRKWPTSA